MKKLALVPLVLFGLTGCAGAAFVTQGVPNGFFFTNAGTGLQATNNDIGRKKGEACAWSILGMVTAGDAGIHAAAVAGNISEISAVDIKTTNILGVYAKMCTIVSGQAEGPTPEHP